MGNHGFATEKGFLLLRRSLVPTGDVFNSDGTTSDSFGFDRPSASVVIDPPLSASSSRLGSAVFDDARISGIDRLTSFSRRSVEVSSPRPNSNTASGGGGGGGDGGSGHGNIDSGKNIRLSLESSSRRGCPELNTMLERTPSATTLGRTARVPPGNATPASSDPHSETDGSQSSGQVRFDKDRSALMEYLTTKAAASRQLSPAGLIKGFEVQLVLE